MALNLTVKHKDGSEIKTEVSASTEVAFEEHFGISWLEAFSEKLPRNTYIYFAAWHSIHDEGKTALDFKTWLKTFDSYEIEDATANPTEQTAPTI